MTPEVILRECVTPMPSTNKVAYFDFEIQTYQKKSKSGVSSNSGGEVGITRGLLGNVNEENCQ